MEKSNYYLGFQSQENEINLDNLPVEGELPVWLSGSLIRTAPSKFEVGKNNYNHWFDGLAMLHKFSFNNKKVSYSCKFLESDAYKSAIEKEKIAYGEFGTDPCRDIFQQIATFFKGPGKVDNACVNIHLQGGGLTSVTETPHPLSFRLATLETKGHFTFTDDLKGQVTPPHPHYDQNGNQYSFITKYGRESEYIIYTQDVNSSKRKKIASVPVKNPAYMHSLGMTENYVILTEFPLVTNSLKFRFSLKPFIEKHDWKPENGTNIYLVHRTSGEVKTFKTEPFFSFHHVNSFEEGEDVLFDLVVHKDVTIIQDFYLENLRSDRPITASGELRRFRVEIDKNKVSNVMLSTTPLELPRINYAKYNTKEYRYVYGVGTSEEGDFYDSILKTDVSSGESIIWREENCYPGEPVFLEKPDAKEEDEGILLSIVLDAKEQNSFLLILDAKDLKEIARAKVPQHITFGFHGQYVAGEEPDVARQTVSH